MKELCSSLLTHLFFFPAVLFLGGELAVALSKIECVEKIVCLVRAECDEEAMDRLRRVFALHEDAYDGNRIVAVAGDLMDERLPAILSQHRILDNVNVVIHAG